MAKDVRLADELAAGGGVGGCATMDELDGVGLGGGLVADFVDGPAASMAKNFELFEVGGEGGKAVVLGRGRAWIGDFGQVEAEIEKSRFSDDGHGRRREEIRVRVRVRVFCDLGLFDFDF
ncbi:hypothetical protein PanWU01x14_292210 [Parasponia andersonii]|uniref:Uncharacterized protein n=1 Tax=Parasponia andersonii TaxID=3476 RepID=A0A2P5AX89_PARAD|nr:hypothetical protein PanWU01x14_292210 [Parasponia andersonii]